MPLRGEWVLYAGGDRRLMTAGDIFRFGPGVPPGYEVPPQFDEEALVLVFKGERSDGSREGFVEYLTEEMNPQLEQERAEGTPFEFADLPEDHPAKAFAASLVDE